MSETEKKRKILIATGIYPPEIGGPATYSKLLMDTLPNRGFEVGVLSFGEVRHLPKFVRNIAYFFKLLWRGGDADIIFAQDTVSVGFPASVAAFLVGARFIIRVPGDYAWEQASQRFGVKESIDDFQHRKYGMRTELLRSVQKFVVNRAEIVITPSRYFSSLVGGWCRNPEKVKTIYNGIALKDVYPAKREARQKLGIEHDTKIIFSAGRLVPWKGFDVLIRLMPELARESGSWNLLIAGDGPDRKRLEEEIVDLGLKEKVVLLGQVPREKLFDHLCAADIFVLNTSFESFSFQIVEAMAAGVPVVSTRVGNLPEIIEHGVDGILVECNNTPELLSAVKRMTGDPAFRESVIAKARVKSGQFTIDSTVQNLVKLLQ
jgi:glycosyltransferase involved in cell wall biosynthesis